MEPSDTQCDVSVWTQQTLVLTALHDWRLAHRPTASSEVNSLFPPWPLRMMSHCQDIFFQCEIVQLSCCKTGL